MKKLLVTALFGAFAVAQETTPVAAPNTHAIFYSLDTLYKLNGRQYKGEHLAQYVYTFSGGYKLKPTVLFQTNYQKDSAGDYQTVAENQYVQLRWSTPKLWDIVGFKSNYELRYTAPTSEGEQLAGSYGHFSNRLIMEKEFSSSFNLTVIGKLGLYAQRNGNQVRAGGTDRNKLVGLTLEVDPQYKFNENLTLTYVGEVTGTYFADGVGSDDELLVKGGLYQELELMYTVESLGNLGLGLVAVNDDVEFGNSKKAKPYKGDFLWVGTRINKNFEL